MKLTRCHIRGFGKLVEVGFSFEDKLNIIFARNEGGKSTLQRFLMALLYGQLRSDLKAQRRLEWWADKYKPWQGAEYGGVLWCRLGDGRGVEIRRAFGKEETRIEIRTDTGEDITDNYEKQRNGDVLFGREHFGMPKELFESVALIREDGIAELSGRDSIRDRIANLAQSGDEELSVLQSLKRMQEAVDSIGSDRAPTKPYKQAVDRLELLVREKEDLQLRRAEFQAWLEERSSAAATVARLEQDLIAAKAAVSQARYMEALARLSALEELESEIRSLAVEIESMGGERPFPVQKLEQLNQLVGARESIGSRLGEAAAEVRRARSELEQAGLKLSRLAAYGRFQATVEAEKLTEWFVGYLSLSRQRDNSLQSLFQLKNEISGLQQQLEQRPFLAASGVDWHEKARAASDQERIGSEQVLELAGKISQEQAGLSRAKALTLKVKGLAAVCFVLSLASIGVRLRWGAERVPMPLWIGLAGVFAVLVVILLISARASRKRQRAFQQAIGTLQMQQHFLREGAGRAQDELRHAMLESGFGSIEDFLNAARRSDQWREKLSDLQTRMQEAERQRDQLIAACDDVYNHLKDALALVGLSCSPANLKAQVDLIRYNLRLHREADARCRNLSEQVSSIETHEADLKQESERLTSAIRQILEEGSVDSPQQFQDACRTRVRVLELKQKLDSREREFQRLCGGITVEDWGKQVAQLRADLSMHPQHMASSHNQESTQSGDADASAPLLPYVPAVDEAIRQEKGISDSLSSARESYARIVERVNHAFQNYRPLSEIEEETAVLQRSIQEFALNRQALEFASETLQTLSRQQQEVLAPQLNSSVEHRFLRLCEARYSEVKIDPDFQIWLRECSTGELRSIEKLSRGTQDQLYFALRFGILDLISNGNESCPCLLDEPFAAYDRGRMEEAFRVLAEETERRQLLLFSCREDLLEFGRKQGAHIIELNS